MVQAVWRSIIAPVGLRQELIWDFQALVLQRVCPLCGDGATGDLCSRCDRQLQRCAIPQPHQTWRGKLPLFAWGYYRTTKTPILKRAIAALKYDQQPILARSLGYAVGHAWRQANLLGRSSSPAPAQSSPPAFAPSLPRSQPIVVPIPLHDRKLKSRGFNQAALLARYFCRMAQLPCAEQGLIRTQETQALFGLDRARREAEVAQVFQVGEGLRGRSVLLFDDIYTTGSTVRSAARTLWAAGIPTIGVVALARAGIDQA